MVFVVFNCEMVHSAMSACLLWAGKSAEVQVVITLGSASFLFLFWHELKLKQTSGRFTGAQAPLRLITELQAPFLLPCSPHLHGAKLSQVLLWFWWQEVGQQWVLTQGIKMLNSSEFSKSKQFVLFSSNETPLGNELKEKYSWKINL